MVSVKATSKLPKKKTITKSEIKEISPKIQKKKQKKVLKNVNKSSEEKKVIKSPKYVLPTAYITENLITNVLSCLEKLTTHYTKKNSIFGDETSIFMEVRSIKIQNVTGNLKFVLPHSTIASTGEVCLITKDLKKGKKIDHEPTVDHWEELLRKANVTSVKTVLPMRQLRVEYDQFELKRRLLTQHDFIMVDTRVINHVSHELGKMFFKKHNMLIPVKINENGDIKKDIDVGLRTVMLRLNEGQTSTVLVGHTGMSQNQIKENILALIQRLKQRFPGGEENIRSISIKLPLSMPLPLYMTLRPANCVKPPKIKQNMPKEYVVYEGELTTKLGSIVSVAPDGTVRSKPHKNNKEDISDKEDQDVDEDMQSEQDDNSENES